VNLRTSRAGGATKRCQGQLHPTRRPLWERLNTGRQRDYILCGLFLWSSIIPPFRILNRFVNDSTSESLKLPYIIHPVGSRELCWRGEKIRYSTSRNPTGHQMRFNFTTQSYISSQTTSRYLRSTKRSLGESQKGFRAERTQFIP
jgi:hypothetical protein